jgi:Uncharacterised protein family (UPF0175)
MAVRCIEGMRYGEDVDYQLRGRHPACARAHPRPVRQGGRFLLAAKLYELGKLSSGQAASLAGKERVDFLLALLRIGVPVSNLQPDEAANELGFGRSG